MGALADSILAATDPVTTLLIIALGYYARMIKRSLQREIRRVRGRIERIEDGYIPDGGSIDEQQTTTDSN